ncbi:hypothetical protein Psi02_36150 [Planotetraspora silvatica]|uniref:Lipoprotein n=1 Tax=Planotetraspora silvatica TaxID=234614 RepID=A0A8J3UPQ8_9ACTN|nr:hypothetical protein [Planotetraspora silvatica]GII47191.1 hypothetical protein Psi02_36150 [Planotetraspora silvatica]
MRRFIATLACATTAAVAASALATPAHAQTRVADPVAVLKKQFVSGHGATFADRTSVKEAGHSNLLLQRSGKFQLNKSGLAASDLTAKFNLSAPQLKDVPKDMRSLLKSERTIRIGTTAYIKGGLLGEYLPKGKTWLKYPKGPVGGTSSALGQLIGVTEPRTLKGLLSHGKRKGSAYSGTTTFADLWKVSSWFRYSVGERPTGSDAKTKVSWKLYVTSKGVITRVVSSYNGRAVGMPGTTFTVDSRYAHWGAKVSLKAPPASQVAGLADLTPPDSTTPPEPALPGPITR